MNLLSKVPVFSILFFMAVFLFVYLWIEPPLLYYSFGVYLEYPHFSLSWPFLERSLVDPGGAAHFLAGFLSQWFVYPLAGATIITASAWLAFAALQCLFSEIPALLRRVLGHLAILALIVGYNQYDHPLTIWLALTLSLWLAVLYTKWKPSKPVVRTVVFTLLFAAAYYWIGAGALLFAIMAMLADLFDKRYFAGVLHFVMGVSLVLVLGYGFFVLEIQDAFLRLTPFDRTLLRDLKSLSRVALQSVYILILLAFFGVALVRLLRDSESLSWTADAKTETPDKGRRFSLALAKMLLACGIPTVIYVLILFYSMSPRKEVLRIHAFSRQAMWPQVLESARALYQKNLYHPCSNFDVNRALYHTGRLPYEMFAHPQHPEALALISMENIPVSEKYNRICDLYYDLGYMNEAQHWAAELLETRGNCPFLLEKLGRVCIIKGQTEAAKVFLHALEKDLICGQTARELLTGLAQNPQTANDPKIAYLSMIRRKNDHAAANITLEELLLELLEENRNNRMAFEYLMAYYLLHRQSDKVVANLYRLKDLGYRQLPRYYAEAALIYMNKTRQPVNLSGYEMDPRIVAQFQKITSAFRSMGYNRQQGQQALAAEFGDSYFYYSMFDVGVK